MKPMVFIDAVGIILKRRKCNTMDKQALSLILLDWEDTPHFSGSSPL